MARHKDCNWNLREGKPGEQGQTLHDVKTIQAALLMDIRDELKQLNALLACPRFIGIPTTLDHIAANTRKPKRGRPA